MENENQSNPRFFLFIALSILIFLGWSYLNEKLYPAPKKVATKAADPAPVNIPQTSPTANASPQPSLPGQATTNQAAAAPVQTELREIHVKTDLWRATLSNQGAVITEWTMTKSPDGKLIDPETNGVNLVSTKLSREIGGFFRFHIPADKALEQELNAARFVIEGNTAQELTVGAGEKKEISFSYANADLNARKKLVFKGVGADKGSGYDFDFQAEVTRNGQPLEAYVVIGPNFGDQAVVQVSTYKHAPQVTYAQGTSVSNAQGESLATKHAGVQSLGEVAWASVDDNYFAMALIPPQPATVPAIGLAVGRKDNAEAKERYLASVAMRVNPGQVNRVYAGPKNLDLLRSVSANFGLGNQTADLEDSVNFGILNFMRGAIKPIARFMLSSLRWINQYTNNYGWAIVLLTVLLNMVFFPLRWRSSVMMKKAAALQPKMKELQDEMKKLDKNDPRVLELQRKQLELMKEGNPLMGCLPLLLQMPFFIAVFAVLTISIEVRHAHFIGWLKDLSSADPLYLLPIIMCVTMIAQTVMTPTANVDPVQKKVSYIMPVVLTYFFFISAPAGLVLYWMVGNVVGVAQQFVINKLTGSPTPASAPDTNKPAGPNAGKKKAKEALAN